MRVCGASGRAVGGGWARGRVAGAPVRSCPIAKQCSSTGSMRTGPAGITAVPGRPQRTGAKGSPWWAPPCAPCAPMRELPLAAPGSLAHLRQQLVIRAGQATDLDVSILVQDRLREGRRGGIGWAARRSGWALACVLQQQRAHAHEGAAARGCGQPAPPLPPIPCPSPATGGPHRRQTAAPCGSGPSAAQARGWPCFSRCGEARCRPASVRSWCHAAHDEAPG